MDSSTTATDYRLPARQRRCDCEDQAKATVPKFCNCPVYSVVLRSTKENERG